MKKLKVILFFLLFVIFLCGCSSKNNKKIVINLDEIKDVTTEKFSLLNIVDNKGDTLYFSQIGDIISGADSSIIIIETVKSRVIQIDKNGNFKKYIGRGRQGSGPGEFNNPVSGVYYNGNHYITDNWGMLIQKYDKDMNYLTTYKIRGYSHIVFINENEILSFYDESDTHIFCVRDTLGNIVRSFGDIEGNEEGVVQNKKRMSQVKFVYDSLYKHIFLVSNWAPIIRRFDLNGNLLQRIDFEGKVIDTLNIAAERGRQRAGNAPNAIGGTQYLINPSIVEGNKLLVSITKFGSLLLEYDEKNIKDKKMIKYEIANVSNIHSTIIFNSLGIKDFNNVRLLYSMFGGSIFVSNK